MEYIITNFKNDQELVLDHIIVDLIELLESHSKNLGTLITDTKLSNNKGLLLLIKDLSLKDSELTTIMTITSSFKNSVNLKSYLIGNNQILNQCEADYVAYENLLEQIVILMCNFETKKNFLN